MTGRYCFRSELKSGVLHGYSQLLIEDETVTVAVGKWHLGMGFRKIDPDKKLVTGKGHIKGRFECGFFGGCDKLVCSKKVGELKAELDSLKINGRYSL